MSAELTSAELTLTHPHFNRTAELVRAVVDDALNDGEDVVVLWDNMPGKLDDCDVLVGLSNRYLKFTIREDSIGVYHEYRPADEPGIVEKTTTIQRLFDPMDRSIEEMVRAIREAGNANRNF